MGKEQLLEEFKEVSHKIMAPEQKTLFENENQELKVQIIKDNYRHMQRFIKVTAPTDKDLQ